MFNILSLRQILNVGNTVVSPVTSEFLSGNFKSLALARPTIGRITIMLFLVNAISAVLFILNVNHKVWDDKNNLPDVYRYVQQGISLESLRGHINPTGPGSFLWIAGGGSILGGELWSYRMAVLASWCFLASFVITFTRITRDNGLIYSGLLAAIALPHSATASATILTEGPALLLASASSMVWLHCVSKQQTDSRHVFVCVLAGLGAGLAVFCRQYYLLLLPAMGCFCLYTAYLKPRSQRWWLMACLSLAAAVVPVAFLYWLWEGLSSPGMASGSSYDRWRASVGLNITRPIHAMFYLLMYAIPFSFPCAFWVDKQSRWISAAFGIAGGLACAATGTYLLQWGPLRSVALSLGRFPYGTEMVIALCGFLAVFNIVNVVLYVSKNPGPFSQPHVVFSLLALAFFVFEQIGVGGNMQFYERYVLQVAPFLGMLAFALVPDYKGSRLLAATLMVTSSNLMLWRYM